MHSGEMHSGGMRAVWAVRRAPRAWRVRVLGDGVLGEYEGERPVDGVLKCEGIEAGGARGVLRWRWRGLRLRARRIDDAEQLVGQIIRQQAARERVAVRVGDGRLTERNLELRLQSRA